jgi:hypothetical protein
MGGIVMADSVFKTLKGIDCNAHTEKKNGLTYLSWAWAWSILKEHYPDAIYTIYENAEGMNYHTDGRTCWVKTGVTVQGIEHIEYLPVMDYRNASITVDRVTSFDVNKAIQRSLTKAVARHGLGLYIYAGEDLPDAADEQNRPAPSVPAPKPAPQPAAPQPRPIDIDTYNKYIIGHAEGKKLKSGKTYREGYISNFHPTKEMLASFDEAVAEYKTNNGVL